MTTPMNESASPEHYWNLTLRDGRVVAIPPAGVAIVQRKMASREPIVTSDFTIPFAEIRSFDKTSRRFGQQSLLPEQVAQAFDEPIITIDETGRDMVKAAWVKMEVTQQEYQKIYSRGTYRKLGNTDDGLVWVAFVLPVHQINQQKHVKCTTEELRVLTK